MKNMACLFLVLLFSTAVLAMDIPNQTNGCHCFKDRVYDPENKFAADKYLLTTSFNSFIAVNFHISKSQIVMMKMKGAIDPDDLLIGLFVERAGGVDFNTLLAVLDNGGTWSQILESESIVSDEKHEKSLNALRRAVASNADLTESVIDQMLKEFFAISDHDIMVLRKEGASGRELTLIYLLERYGKRDMVAADILSLHIRKKKSWGEIANYFGFTPKETGKLLQEPG